MVGTDARLRSLLLSIGVGSINHPLAKQPFKLGLKVTRSELKRQRLTVLGIGVEFS